VIATYIQILIVAAAFTTVTSGAQYLIDWWRRMNRIEQKP
jgi:phosphatidylglycerophosphate synthase